mgnify:FL=1|jgi:hypothetical protein|tara:strand:- start:30 stop:263 length:234 start_codon:yes stop_codon:yes gene_type:complete
MKEQTLIEMSKKIDALINVSQKLIQEIQQIDSVATGTLTSFQLYIGEKEWKKLVIKMKKLDDKKKTYNEKKLDLNVE